MKKNYNFLQKLFSRLMKNKSIINKKSTEKVVIFRNASTTAMENNLYSMYGAKMGQ